MKQLISLNLYYTMSLLRPTPTPFPDFSNLTNLRQFGSYGNAFFGEFPAYFETFPLRDIALSGESLTGFPSRELFHDLTSFTYTGYWLSNAEFYSTIDETCNLERLTLQQTRMGGPIPTQLLNCSRLTQLSLDNNGFGPVLPAAFLAMPRLVNLLLSSNLISVVEPFVPATRTSIQTVYLRSNRISGPITPELAATIAVNAPNWDLTGNQLECPRVAVEASLALFDKSWSTFQTRVFVPC